MGNTPSHSQGDASSTPGPSGGTPQASSSPTPGPSSSQPITHPISTTPHAASTFHSGLTPPTKPPSPDPPGTPPLLPYGGHLSPQNPHALTLAQAKDYSKTIVTRLVMEARLAPFYRGLEDYEEDSTKEDIGKLLDEVREKDYEAGVQNSVVEQMKADRDGPSGVGGVVKKIGIHKARDSRALEERDEAYRREKKAYLGALECPICFLVSLIKFGHDVGTDFRHRATRRISTPLDAASNPSVPNVSSRSGDPNPLSPISNQNLPVARSAWRRISGSYTSVHRCRQRHRRPRSSPTQPYLSPPKPRLVSHRH